MSRATSTVLDVTLFLLLLGAAAAAVLGGVADDPTARSNPAADQAELLGTSTAHVSYALEPPGSPPDWTANATARHRRTAHGTVAQLLADAAMSNVAVEKRRLSTAGTDFERAVAETTRSRLTERREPGRVSAVRVRWEPYRGAPMAATTRVGERPPPTADARAATLTVPSPMADMRERATRTARTSGFRGVAAVVARAVVDGLFPPSQVQLALRGDYPADTLMATRYRRMAALTDAGRLPVRTENATRLNDRLTASLTDTFERDMRARFGSPRAAAGTVETGTVRITVRTWSP
ncbi:DUF7284 family protein [Haloarcula nitratireducens]|uniref:Uncharacterized protein n=1 Tax=Haloarcula nitratireducens TaxID=2487749 RepID=A0AAW4P6Y6_9EURY|nr:hypothetical protein [Halomicroarcula nitratireducens]MBX0293470.1 hypothetical protein [Halomicroarcula nitratireducens]